MDTFKVMLLLSYHSITNLAYDFKSPFSDKEITFVYLSWRVPWPILKRQRSFERLARLFVNFEDVADESLQEQHRHKDNHKRQQSSPDLKNNVNNFSKIHTEGIVQSYFPTTEYF